MKYSTLKLNKEFRRLYGRGKSFVQPSVVIYILKNKYDEPRIGITTGKKIGCAVKRNRARRLITAAWHSCIDDLTVKNLDIVFVARTRIIDMKSTEVEGAIRRAFQKAGVIK